MADDLLDAQTGAEETAEVNAAAVALALDGATAKPELSEAIAAFLKEQRKLMEEQREQLRDQVRRLKLGIIDQRFSIALKAMTALIVFAVAGALALMVWNAAGSGGLVIEPFSVPPDLAARGLTGQVVASKLLDRLVAMQQQTDSQRDPATYTNYWGDDVKVEIPSTGVSIGELERFLREKLGHPTHITGEIVRDDQGLSLTARAGTLGSGTVRGGDTNVDALVQKLAESVYGITEPYRYGAWLAENGRAAEGIATFVAVKNRGSASERPWGYLGWANSLEGTEGVYARLRAMRDLHRRWPAEYLPGQNVGIIEDELSHPAQVVADLQESAPLLSSPTHGGIRLDVVPIVKKRVQSFIDLELGNFHEATPLWKEEIDFGPQGVTYNMHSMLARAQLGEHDLRAARATMADPHEPGGVNPEEVAFNVVWLRMMVEAEARNWPAVIAEERSEGAAVLSRFPTTRTVAPSATIPLLAYAYANLGNSKLAEALVVRTPADCYRCLLMRAKIAEIERRHARADWWFARAIAQQPSIPFAYSDWGAALFARGKADDAIAKFDAAHQKGPHFADPLEMWGEALIAKNRSDLALAKFEEANKYAPNWGRLHLKWGEALWWSGDKDEAKKQFAVASGLDLSTAEKSELTAMQRMPRG
jgi:tetratricopeptide (TPR) repeat protein